MGLLEWLNDLGRKEPLERNDRRCSKCSFIYYNQMDRKWKCSNSWAPAKYSWLCEQDPHKLTDCPKFDYKS